MVGSRYPAGIFSKHSCTADKNILDGIVQHMPHVQYPGNIGRRYYYGVWLSAVGNRFKKAMFYPVVVPFVFNEPGIIFTGDIHIIYFYQVSASKNITFQQL